MQNKLILITGGSSGIGKAAAIDLHRQGARIILQARGLEKLIASAKEIDPAGERISYYSTDLTDQNAVEEAAKTIIAKEGLPDSASPGFYLHFHTWSYLLKFIKKN